MTRSAAGTRTASATRTQAPLTQNLWTQSQDFAQAVWSKSNLTITAAAINGPTGSLDGTAIIATSTASVQHLLFRPESSLALVGRPYALAWYAKAGAVNFCSLILGGAAVIAYYTLTGAGSSSVATGSGTPGILNVGTGWYLCSCVLTPRLSAGGINSGIYPASAQANGANTYAAADTTSAQIYVQGAQASLTNWVPPYAVTTASVVNTGAPRSFAGARTAA